MAYSADRWNKRLQRPACSTYPRRVVARLLVRTAKKTNRLSVATAALGALLGDSGLFPAEAFAEAIPRFQKPDIAEPNRRALEAGVALVADN